MALTRDPAHNGTPPAIKSDKQSATSSSGEPSATAALAGQTQGPPLHSTVHIWCVCAVRKPHKMSMLYYGRRHQALTIDMGI